MPVEAPKIVIAIDDFDVFAEEWTKAFSGVEGVEAVRPQIPDDDTLQKEIRDGILKFLSTFPSDRIPHIAAVIIDQFNDDGWLRQAAKQFIISLRAENREAWVLETSGEIDGLVYPGSNAAIQNGVYSMDAADLVGSSSPILAVRLQALQLYSHAAFVEAGYYDPSKTELGLRNVANQDYIKMSLDRLKRNKNFVALNSLLGFNNNDEFGKCFRQLSVKDQGMVLHYAWNIIGHIMLSSDPGFYTGSLGRLQKLLGII